ncbi:MAG: undecaprenyl-phosphate glucose phosphotransferase [Anaerolineales bacterium]|nr:MAG: undecaprenyl-phosphate glucose phosphotransferase [Anaerolineales bacterium]
MKQKINLLLAVSLVVIDGLMTALAFFLAYWLRLWINIPSPPVNIQPFPNYLGMMAIQVLTMLTVFFFSKLYHLKRGISRLDEFSTIFAASSIGNIISIAFTSLLFKNSPLELDYSRGMVVYAWLLTIVLVFLGRVFHDALRFSLRSRGVATDKVLIVGTGEIGQIILHKIRHSPRLGYEVVGFIDGASAQEEVRDVPILGGVDDIPSLIDAYEIDEVIIGLPEASHQEILTVISHCEREKVSIKVFPDVFQIMASEVSIGDLGGLPLLTIRDIALQGWKLTLKRVVDLIGGAVGLVLISPLLMLISLLVKLDSPGPVFYAQERMGLDARPFWMLKFRSMLKDAESQTGPIWATKDDPRRTKIGAFMRRFSIDELPQLINVLLGEMSLVGPRPERPVFVEQFRQSIPRYMDRHREKAGITGWAQVNGLRGDTSIAERTKYDLWYIENWSLLLDFKIILRTLIRVFADRNAS